MRVGVVCSRGDAFLASLRRGLDGRAELDVADACGGAGEAVAAAERLRAAGAGILVSSLSSPASVELAGFAARERVLLLAGTAATGALTGINRFTFRSARSVRDDVLTLAALLEGAPQRVRVVSPAGVLGAEVAAVASRVLTARGHTVVATGDHDRVFAACGPVEPGPVPVFAPHATGVAGGDVTFIGPAADEGEVVARMLARALAAAPDLDAMVAALESWCFESPHGTVTIRPHDHALLQPMLALRAPAAATVVQPSELGRLEPPPPPESGPGLQHVGILVGDLERSIRFYVEALGGQLLVAPVPFEPPEAQGVFGGPADVAFRFALVGFGGTGLELFQFAGGPVPPSAAIARGLPHFALQVSDTGLALERVEACGGSRVWATMGGFGRARTWYAADPDGNLLELIDRPVWAVSGAAHDLYPAQNPPPPASSPYT